MPIKPIYSLQFDVPDEGTYLMQVENVEFNSSDRGLSCSIRSVIIDAVENQQCIGMKVFDNFPLWTELGRGRLLGFLIKATGLKEKEYPDDFFSAVKVQQDIMKKATGAKFGGVIRHSKGEKGIFANIKEYLSSIEYHEKFGDIGTATSTVTASKDEDSAW
jgi:hypothetical protein